MRDELFGLKLATYNINGIKARIEAVCEWLDQAEPDLVCLQEIKSPDENFPAEAFEARGYNVAVHGQKSFNGVALLSKWPLEAVLTGLPGDDDDIQARFITTTLSGESGALRFAGAYMPNGNPVDTEKYTYKLAWMERLERWLAEQLADEIPLVLTGDFNIIPEPIDAKNPDNWREDALFRPQTREIWRRLSALGLTDAVRATSDAPETYSFWDFQGGAWPKNNGIRIDHFLLSSEASDRLVSSGIDKHVRSWERPSDHVPVWINLGF